jgi:hypothetical protein
MVMQQQQQQQQQQQDKTSPDTEHPLDELLWIIQIELTCFRRYPGDTPKLKKTRHQSLTSFPNNHESPNCKKGKTQHNPIPNGIDTISKFQTYKNAGKTNNDQKHIFQNTTWTQHAPTS